MTRTAKIDAETNTDNFKDPSTELEEIGAALAVAMAENEPELSKVHRARMIAKETGQPLDRVAKDTDRDHWMTVDEAVSYGIVSNIIESIDELS